MKWIGVFYKCRCMVKERELYVPARGKRENVIEFMDRTRDLVAADHAIQSPMCMTPAAEYLKIPMKHGKHVGEVDGGEA